MDINFFPDVLKNIRISNDGLYLKNHSILFYSLKELEIYIDTYCYDNLISAVSTYPEIYNEKGLDLNETFLKISPKQTSYSKEEKEYILNKIVTPSTIAWTSYQYLIKLIQNSYEKNVIKNLLKKKELLENAVLIKNNEISEIKFKQFLYGNKKKSNYSD